MSFDIGLSIKPDNRIDVSVAGADLVQDPGLRTAILISLFSDRRVDAQELPAGETRRRGWWGDLFPSTSGDQIGSRLWLLKREKRTQETLNRAEEYSKEALQWLIDDGVASSVAAQASFDQNGALVLAISLDQPSGNKTFRFSTQWAVERVRGSS